MTQQASATKHLLFTSTVLWDEFQQFIASYRIPTTPTYMMLEEQPRRVVTQEDRHDLLRFELFDRELDLKSYTSGRIFHEHGELRWERQQKSVKVVYTGDAEWQPNLQSTAEPYTLTSLHEDRDYLLFGERLDSEKYPQAQPEEYAEVRIPRILHYPRPQELAQKKRLHLVVCEYIDEATGATVAYRFKGFPPEKKDGGEDKA